MEVFPDFFCIHAVNVEGKCFQCDAENNSDEEIISEIKRDAKRIFWFLFFAAVLWGVVNIILTA